MIYEYLSTTDYHGCVCVNFKLNGRESLVVRPHKPLPGNPVCWRTEFFGAFDAADRAMLARGWHLCYHKCSNMYGCDESIEMLHEFHEFVIQTFGLARQAVLFGFSRGGLYAINYAAKYPEFVKGLYLDAPVLDIKSWPCRYTDSPLADQCLQVYGLTRETLATFSGSPIDKIEQIAHLPIILVCGDADLSVPFVDNGQRLIDAYQRLGGTLQYIIKPGAGHHPHSLEEPASIVSFIEENCLPLPPQGNKHDNNLHGN